MESSNYYQSLHTIHLDELASKVGGRHRLTYLISQRLKAINGGAQYLVSKIEGEAPLATVCREISEDKIWLEIAEEEVKEVEDDLDILGLSEDF